MSHWHLDIAPDVVRDIAMYSKTIHAQEENDWDDLEYLSHDDYDYLQTLADHHDEMVPGMLEELIDQLPEEQLYNLLAIVYIGRGDYDVDEWEQALDTARHLHKEHPGHYLLTMPHIADYLEEGLALVDA